MKSDKNTLILYHGSPNKEIRPTYGLGNDKHDYGKGFYLTESRCWHLSGQSAILQKITDGYISIRWMSLN